MSENSSASQIVLFESSDGEVTLDVAVDRANDDVWLNRSQLSTLFDRDVKTIGKHINNALREELSEAANPTVAKFATVQMEGKRPVERQVEYYNLDVILSVGYRVKSQRGIEFRRWANDVLRRYIVEGRAENARRLKQLAQVVFIVKNHSFHDGNKRIAASMFLYFLDKNGLLYAEDAKTISDEALVATTIMIAESKPEEKEAMVLLVMNFLD